MYLVQCPLHSVQFRRYILVSTACHRWGCCQRRSQQRCAYRTLCLPPLHWEPETLEGLWTYILLSLSNKGDNHRSQNCRSKRHRNRKCNSLKGLLMGRSISITNKSYHYALSRKLAQVSWAVHGTCVWTLRHFDRYMMYTDIELEYHSHLSTTYILD